jgi:hypothetical protein
MAAQQSSSSNSNYSRKNEEKMKPGKIPGVPWYYRYTSASTV